MSSTPDDDLRGRLIRLLWREIRSYDAKNVRQHPTAARAVDAGASAEDVALAMTAAAYEAVFRALFPISCEHTEEENIDSRIGWALVPARLDKGEVTPILSDALVCLHEDLLTGDPAGREGGDFLP
jgi:hypothetical protein